MAVALHLGGEMADLIPPPRPHRPDLDLPVALAVLGGAVLGGLAGYLLLTAPGMRLREDLDALVDRLGDGFDMAFDGWHRFQRPAHHQDAAADVGAPSPPPTRAARGDLT